MNCLSLTDEDVYFNTITQVSQLTAKPNSDGYLFSTILAFLVQRQLEHYHTTKSRSHPLCLSSIKGNHGVGTFCILLHITVIIGSDCLIDGPTYYNFLQRRYD